MTKVGSGAAQKGKNRWGPYFSQIPGGQGEADCKSGESCLWGWWMGREVVLTATPMLAPPHGPHSIWRGILCKEPQGPRSHPPETMEEARAALLGATLPPPISN